MSDLLGYQDLIIDASREFEGEYWMGYDCRFRQWAAVYPTKKWANVEPTLWNLTFAGQANLYHCKLCFSTMHKLNDCELAGDYKYLQHLKHPAHLKPCLYEGISISKVM